MKLPTRQVHLDFHTSEFIPGVGSSFSKENFQEAPGAPDRGAGCMILPGVTVRSGDPVRWRTSSARSNWWLIV